MTKKIKLNYDQTYVTQHTRNYYRGKSFHFSGKWVAGAHYVSDDYDVDFVVHGQSLLACAKSHLSTVDNEPVQYVYNDQGDVSGVVSTYWDFVLGSVSGTSPGIKIIDNYWWICENISVPEEQQVWVNTGVKAKMELSDLSPEEIEILQRPGKELIEDFMNNVIVQTTGNNRDKLMSQDSVTKELNTIGLVTAEHIAQLHKNIQNIITNWNTLDNATAISLSLQSMLKINDSDLILVGSSSPSIIPDFIGQFYNNTSNRLPYIALGNSSTSDWIALATKSSLDSYKNDVSSLFTTVNQRITTNTNTITTEVSRLDGLISSETTARRNGDSYLEDLIASEADTRQQNNNFILNKIPAEATSVNKLADKAFVENLVSTSSAVFRGTYGTLAELQQQEADLNDYGFVQWIDQIGNVIYSRYKYDGTAWRWEYDQTNTQFSVAQQAAIDSGVTEAFVTKLSRIGNTIVTNITPDVVTVTPNGLPSYTIVNGVDVFTLNLTTGNSSTIDLTDYLVAKVYGKDLSANDFTDLLKNKLDNIESTAQVNILEGVQVNGTDLPITNKKINIDLSDYQSLILDLSTIRSGAALGATAYQLPSTGIPYSDLSSTVQASLDKADSAIQDISGKVDKVTNESLTPIRVENYLKTDYTGSYSEYSLTIKDNATNNSLIIPIGSTFTHSEKEKLGGIASGAQVNVIEEIQINGTTQTITNKVVNLPAYPTTLPASDVYEWAKAATKPTYTPSEVGAATSVQGSLADTAIQAIQIDGVTQTKTSGVVNLPAYPTTLPASDVYAWAKEASKPSYDYSEINNTPSSLPASDVSAWAKASTKPSYTFSEIGSTPITLAGYGITDAYISNGTITLGSNTITPVTTETDPTVPSWAKASTKPSYTLDEVSDGSTRMLSNYKTIASLQSKGSASLPVYFDANGDAQTITSYSGNAATATKLASAITIWGQSFDGSSNITGALSSVTDITASGALSGNAFKVIAEHIAELNRRINNLELTSDSKSYLNTITINVREGFYYNGDKTILSGSGAPSAIPGFVGQFYIDTTNKKLYFAAGISAVSDWILS